MCRHKVIAVGLLGAVLSGCQCLNGECCRDARTQSPVAEQLTVQRQRPVLQPESRLAPPLDANAQQQSVGRNEPGVVVPPWDPKRPLPKR
jgi:hypothetical protein